MKKWDENQFIFNFLLHVRGTSQHFLRSNHLEMCYFFIYLHIYETQVHSCLGTAIPGILHPKFWKFCDRHIFSLFLTKTKPFLLSLFWNGTSTIQMLNFSIWPTDDITLTLLKQCKTVTSEDVNSTKSVTISDRLNEHVHI